jgi:DNA polymerase-3 subunit gamma/tau
LAPHQNRLKAGKGSYMLQALYRRWRPQTWDEVAGQGHIVQTLRNAVKGERLAHAYLFAGPRGTGKTTVARLLAKAANCLAESPGDRPCNSCVHCKAVNEGRFLDLIEIDAASNTSVEDVRDLRDKINFSPNEGRFKVYIVDEVHMLSTAAFNALLKTLEEPPPHAIFVLATTEVHKIPATVLSRCQRHEFRRLPVDTIIGYLHPKIEDEGLMVAEEALEVIARQATGSLRDAISLLDQLSSTGERVTLVQAQEVLGTAASEAVRSVVQALVESDYASGLTMINRALDGGADPRQFARQMVDYLRGLLLVRMGNADLVDATDDSRVEMAHQADKLPMPKLLHAIRGFGQVAAERRASWLSSLPLELAFVEGAGFEAAEAPVAPPSPPSYSGVHHQEQPEEKAPGQEAEVQANPPSRTEGVVAGEISFKTIMDNWRDVLAAARRHDPRTQALLNSCRPLGLEAGVLVIGFGSDLLREKMDKGNNIALACKVLQEVLGVTVNIRCVLTSLWAPGGNVTDQPPPMEENGMVSTALRDLGAQVVDFKPLPPKGGSGVGD